MGKTVVEYALCLNCGARVPVERRGHVVMGFRPGVAEIADYVVVVDGVEVHRCSGPRQTSRLAAAEPRSA